MFIFSPLVSLNRPKLSGFTVLVHKEQKPDFLSADEQAVWFQGNPVGCGGPKSWILFPVPVLLSQILMEEGTGIDWLRDMGEEKHFITVILLLLKMSWHFLRCRVLEEHTVKPVHSQDSTHKQTCQQKAAKILIKKSKLVWCQQSGEMRNPRPSFPHKDAD